VPTVAHKSSPAKNAIKAEEAYLLQKDVEIRFVTMLSDPD